MYTVFKSGKEIGTGTLTECIEFVATQMSQFRPEQVTAKQAVAAGYSISRA
jgi:hypothetical protein